MPSPPPQALQKSNTKLGAIALGSLAGLWLLKRVGVLGMVPGLGRFARGGRRPRGEDLGSDDYWGAEGGEGRGGGGGGKRRGPSKEERLYLAYGEPGLSGFSNSFLGRCAGACLGARPHLDCLAHTAHLLTLTNLLWTRC